MNIGVQAGTQGVECLRHLREELYRPLIDQAMPDALFVHDHGGRLIEVNAHACKSLGYSRAELLSMTVMEIEADFDLPAARAVWTRIRPDAPTVLYGRHRCKDGRLFPVEVHIGLLESHGERIYIGVTRDITDRRRAERALAEREAQYRAATETAADGFWMVDEVGRLLAVNDAYVRRSGYSREELLTKSVADLDAGEDPEEVRRHIEVLRRQGSELFETWHITKGGEHWPVEVNATYWADAGGRFFAFLRDITQRRQVAAALRESEERFRATFEQAAVGIAHVAPDGRWLRVNRKLCEILGYSREELLARDFQSVTHPDDLQEGLDYVRRLLARELPTFTLVKRYLRKDGGSVWAHITSSLTSKPDGSPDYFITVMEDIGDRRRLEQLALERRHQMEDMIRQQVALHTAAAFVHELNQPLVAISAYSEVALRLLRSGAPELGRISHHSPTADSGEKCVLSKLTRVIEGCYSQAQRAGQVLHELLDQLQNGEVEAKPFDLNRLVREVVSLARERESRRFQAVLELDPGLPPVLGNRLQTEKVLVNLLTNGVEAMQGAGAAESLIAIRVAALPDRDLALVEVRDSGPGLEEAAARHLFDPFFTTKPGGIGLGLAISRSLIEAQGGELWLDPEAGPGAVFHFTLPIAHE